MNVSDTCNAAADLLQVSGWTFGQGGWESEAGPYCLEGAIAACSGREMEYPAIEVTFCPAYKAVHEYLDRKPWSYNDGLIYTHNGNPYPTHSPESMQWAAEQVIATLRAVAVIHAARENESVETGAVEAVTA